MSGLDPEDRRELLAVFLLDAPERAARIELGLDEVEGADSDPARSAAAAAAAHEAHSLRGAAGTVGLPDVAVLADHLELMLTDVAPVARARDVLETIKARIAEVEKSDPIAPRGRGPDDVRLVALHVEDNTLNARLVERVLARRPGVRLLTARRGDTALRLARDRRPDLILLDLNLPDMSGLDVIDRLRADPTMRDIPVVVVTADEPERVSHRLRDAAIRDYVPKPLDVGRLLELVDEIASAPPAERGSPRAEFDSLPPER